MEVLMSELVFCCPNCLTVDSSGAIIDDRYTRSFPRSPMRVICTTCETDSLIPMVDFVLANPFAGDQSGRSL